MNSSPLLASLPVWENELKFDIDSDFLLSGIRNGFSIIASSDINHVKPACCGNYKSATNSKVKMQIEDQIKQELQLSRYVICSNKPLIVSALGAIPKPQSTEYRLIHDCSRPSGHSINDYAESAALKFNTVDVACKSINQGWYMAKLDLKAAYRSVGINPNHYQLTGLQWTFEGCTKPTYMFDTRLMFGASQAVEIFHRLSNAIVRMVKRRLTCGDIINYLDDFLIVAPTKAECQDIMDVTIKLVTQLGFDINWQKVSYPSTTVTFLGIVLNSLSMHMYIPAEKLSELKTKANGWLAKAKATKRELQSLAGSIAWGAKCVKAMRPILRNIINLAKKLKAAHHHIRIPAIVKSDLRHFIQWCDRFNGVSFCESIRALPVTSCYTDATPLAGAAYTEITPLAGASGYAPDFYYAAWAEDWPELSNQSIYIKELAAVYLAISKWSHIWSNHRVHVYVDNQGVVWSIRKGLVVNTFANKLVHWILWLAALYNIDIVVEYIPTKANVIADTLSRLADHENFGRAFSYLAQRGHNPYTPCYDLMDYMSSQSFSFLLSRYITQGTET